MYVYDVLVFGQSVTLSTYSKYISCRVFKLFRNYKSELSFIPNAYYAKQTTDRKYYIIRALCRKTKDDYRKSVVIETVRGNLQDVLADVKPDHIVVESYDNDTVFYVRIQQIVHVMPISRKEVSSEQLFD